MNCDRHCQDAECCRHIIVPTNMTLTKNQTEWLRARGVKTKKTLINDYYQGYLLLIPSKCPNLSNQNLCKIHKTKPAICKNGKCPHYTSEMQGFE